MFDVNKIRLDFPMFSNNPELVYLDNAATTFKPKIVIDAVNKYYTHESVNVHRGDYQLSHEVSNEYENTRAIVAEFINCKPKEIVFTSGASASLNLVAYGYGQKNLKKGDVILTTEAEHASNILPWFKVAEVTGAIVEYVPLDGEGKFKIDGFKRAMHSNVKVVAIANVSNVLGYVLPIKEICSIAHSFGAIVVCDGAQAVPHIKTDVLDSGVDFLAFSSHKMLGPTGVGVLYGKYDLLEDMNPFMLGGGANARFDTCGNILLRDAPYKFEAGTPAIEAVMGLGKAIEYLMNLGMDNISKYERELHSYLIEQLIMLDNIHIYNPSADCGIVSFNAKGIFAQDASDFLNSRNIAVRSGNHCAKILMDVLNTSYTIRASLYFYNTKMEVDQFIDACSNISLENCVDIVV